MIALKGAPDAIIEKINIEIRKAMSDKVVRDALDRDGAEAWTMTPGEFRAFIDQEIKRWAEVVKLAKIGLD